MYARVLFLLCAFANLIKADYSIEAKYIDLLPEDEKTQFLDRIARRIISEIRSRSGTQKASVEISDERLNEHDAYVKQIIDEESQDMKNIRRIEDDLKNERNKDVDFVEFQVKPLEQNDHRDQETLENVNLSASENKIRIKKGTPETNTERSEENTEKTEDTLSTVPVHLLYDDTGNLKSTEFTVNENTGHNNQIKTVLAEKKSDELNIDLTDESKDIELKDQVNETLINVNSAKLEQNEGDSIPKAQTIIYDFEPNPEEVTEYRNDTTETSSDIVRAKQFELDEASDKWIEIHPKNVTEDQLKASSVLHNVKEVTVSNENATLGTISDFISVPATSHTSTNNILNTSEWISTTSAHSFTSNLQYVEAFSSNKTVEHNVNVTESYLQPATPSSLNDAEFGRKDEGVATTIIVHAASTEEKTEGTDPTAQTKPSLRLNQEDLNKFHKQLRLIKDPYLDPTNNNGYQVTEVVPDKPFVQFKQMNTGNDEAPYYVPVYNYASNNAFYNPYNRFGPNNGNNPEVIEIEYPYSNKEPSYGPSKFNSGKINEKSYWGWNKKQMKEDQGQRKSKYDQNDDEYDIDNKIPYQKNPVMKGKVINIHFNPNDYLDMDYYLGRSNSDNLEPVKHVVKKGKPVEVSNSQDTSSEVIDPISKEPYNMKDVIRNIRLQMNSLKMNNKSRAIRSHHDKLQQKLKIVDKILGNPIFRGLSNSLVVFIPKTRTKDFGTKDIRDNIAVDYYFSRMSSGEIPYLDDEQQLVVDDNDLAHLRNTHFLKTNAKGTKPVIEGQQPNIPLKLDNVLKIDLAMNNNNVNELLRKVKKPKATDFEVLLKAYLNVLKDMIEYDNKGLIHYDWLGSAVDVQSALDKLMNLSDIMHVRDDVHRYDINLFRYVLFIFKTSIKSLVEMEKIKKDNKRKSAKVQKSAMEPDKNIHQQFEAWRQIKMYMREMRDLNVDVYNNLLDEFKVFLSDLRSNLNELHDAIKGIASVTKYNGQRWYLDLKELYVTPLNRKVSLTLLLHLVSTRLFGLIEESAKNGLEDDFILYVRTHKMEVEATRQEFVLVLRLLKELNRLKK